MKPYGDELVTVTAQVEGLRQAVGRLSHAASNREDAVALFYPLFEALSWVDALNQRVGEYWRPDGEKKPLERKWREKVPHGQTVAGLDWVRNVVHHDWADALRLDPTGHATYPSPTTYPSPNLYPSPEWAWVWRDLDQLPTKRGKDERESAYETSLAGQPAAETMSKALETFEFVANVLEPPRAPSGAD